MTTVSRSDFDYVDPALAYFSHSWNMMAATNLTLTYYPHIEGAGGSGSRGWRQRCRASRTTARRTRSRSSGASSSRHGANVTAANFKRAFDRGKNPRRSRRRRRSWTTSRATRQRARSFTVTLKKAAPDFLARMSMMFFSAVPVNLPFTAEGIKAPVVSAGPYYLKEWNEGKSALAVRNPNWKNNQEPFKSLGFEELRRSVRWIVGPDPATQRPDVRARRGGHLLVPARPGEGARREVRHQQEASSSSSADRRSGTSR